MSWTIIYIKGKEGFESAIEHKLNQSGFPSLPGSREAEFFLYWIDNAKKLREFKKAIGSKTIFKYRIEFYSDLQQYYKLQNQRPLEDTLKEEERLKKLIQQGTFSARSQQMA